MKNVTDRLAPILPWLGLALLLIGAVAYFVTRAFDLATVLPLAAGALCLLAYALLRPDDVRQLLGGRQTRHGASTALAILFFIAIAIILYIIVFQNPDWRLDLTETNEFTPLPETVELLEQVDEPIRVVGFYTVQAAFAQEEAAASLDSLKAVSNDFSYQFIDPNADPLLAQQYELTTDGTLVFIKGEGEDEVFSKSATTTDRDIHSALLQVINPVSKTAYFLTGHGERALEDSGPAGIRNAASDLAALGFTVEELNLALAGEVPAGADVVVLMDQVAPLQAVELEALGDFLGAGGAALIARDVVLDEARARVEEDGLNTYLLDEWGVDLQPDFIVEPELAIAGQLVPVQFITLDFGASPITSGEIGSLGTVFDIARSVSSVAGENLLHTDLARTTPSSWGETNIEAEPAQDADDNTGPLAVGVSVEKPESGGRLVVFGDADFARNELIYLGGNNLLFSNAVNWLVGDETTLELTPRETVARQIVIPQTQLNLVQAVSCLIGPALMAIIGFLVWYNRRQNR
jgi:ABC-type uncharacterized transport system involved in gliding motility auxiliary subunit